MTALNLVPRSPIQVYYYLAHGVDVPAKHLKCGLAKSTLGPDGEVFDWHHVTQDLFTVHHANQICRPKNAHVAIKYHGHWFYIANDDAASKSTFALVFLLSKRRVRPDCKFPGQAPRSNPHTAGWRPLTVPG